MNRKTPARKKTVSVFHGKSTRKKILPLTKRLARLRQLRQRALVPTQKHKVLSIESKPSHVIRRRPPPSFVSPPRQVVVSTSHQVAPTLPSPQKMVMNHSYETPTLLPPISTYVPHTSHKDTRHELVNPPPIIKSSVVQSSPPSLRDSVWQGLNIHAYTHQVNQTITSYIPQLTERYGEVLPLEDFNSIIQQMEKTYGPKVVYSNFKNIYTQGWIRDPEVPGLNSAILLHAVWEMVKQKGDDSIYKHFNETLDQIGSLCIQGVTHRLFIDYVALYEDEIHSLSNR